MKKSQLNLLRLGDTMGSKYSNDQVIDQLTLKYLKDQATDLDVAKYADLTTWFNGNPPIDSSFVRDQAQSAIQSAVLNAASNPASGLMNFPQMLQDGKEKIAFNIVRSGDKILVSVPTVDPPAESNKYFPLRQQIQTYLQNNLNLFPELKDNRPVEYKNFSITIRY